MGLMQCEEIKSCRIEEGHQEKPFLITDESDWDNRGKHILSPLPECERTIDYLNHLDSFTQSDLGLIEIEIGKLTRYSDAINDPIGRMYSELAKWHKKVQESLNKKASAN